MIESPAGAVKPALTPLMKRVVTSRVPSFASAAEGRGHHEHAQGNQEHAAAPEQVRRPAAEQQEAAVAEHVGAHDPLERARRHAQLGAIEGSATPVIDTSSASRKSAPQSTSSAPQARRLRRPLPSSRMVFAVANLDPFGYCSIRIVHSCSMSVKQ